MKPGWWSLTAAALAATLLTAVGEPSAAEFRVTPAITVSGEYTNRVDEKITPPRDEWITRLQPGFGLLYDSGRIKADAGYTLDYRTYANRSYNDRLYHSARFRGLLEPIPERFFINLSDTWSLTSIDIVRDASAEGIEKGFVRQNLAAIDAYLLFRPSPGGKLKVGYRFRDARYWGDQGIDKSENGGFVDYTHELTPRLSLVAESSSASIDTAVNRFVRTEVNGGVTYEYAERSAVTARVGNVWNDFSDGRDASDVSWNLGVTRTVDNVHVSLSSKVAYTEDPLTVSTRETGHQGKVTFRGKRYDAALQLGYAEYYLTEPKRRDRRKGSASLTGRYELMQGTDFSLSGTIERYTRTSAVPFPWRVIVTPRLDHSLNKGLSLSAAYSWVSNRDELGEWSGARDTHRAMLELKKSF